MTYQVTGNAYVSLPTIRERDGGIEGITFLHMGAKGMLEVRGRDAVAKPYFEVNGKQLIFTPRWSRTHYWIPALHGEAEGMDVQCTYLCPMDERGFGLQLTLHNLTKNTVVGNIGLTGDWNQTLHEVNETKELEGGQKVRQSGWNHMFVWEQWAGLPLFALAPITEDNQPFSVGTQGATWHMDGKCYNIHREKRIAPGETMKLDVFFGIGFEEVAAATSAKEMLRQSFKSLYNRTEKYLASCVKPLQDPKLSDIMNTNMLFALFFACGRTIDTEELCLMTSRSPRYYVSAAYWDRDSLLWAFPAILMADVPLAKEVLTYVFTKQRRNFGIHSRYIDGTVLEPGFELDELCAPVIALERYVSQTGDMSFLQQTFIRDGLRYILDILNTKKHPHIHLYETFLQPTDDMHNYPYLTYDNVLVWRSLDILASYLDKPALHQQAQQVREAILTYCVKEKDGKQVFAWSVDLNGQYDIYDEPPGSLQLLPFYGFCTLEDPIWCDTVKLIRSPDYQYSFAGKPIAEIGCAHAPHPWVLSICNSLLCGHKDSALRHLQLTTMDNGIACESINEDTGICETGEAFATCAGFLSYALMKTCET